MLEALYLYRYFILESVKREFQARYQGSLLGGVWAILNPLAMIFVYIVIFSGVMKAKLPGLENDRYSYSIYLCSGVLTWGLFSEIVSRCTTVFIDHANILKKVSFPKICLPVIVVCNALVNFFIITSIFFIFLIVIGEFPDRIVFSAIPLLLIEIVFAVGLGIFLGTLNVFFRDIGHSVGIILQFWFWFTPIVYPETILSGSLRHWVRFNPMYYFVSGYHDIFTWHRPPDYTMLMRPAVLSLCICFFALQLYRRHMGEIVDEL